jgi:hypothetical protein
MNEIFQGIVNSFANPGRKIKGKTVYKDRFVITVYDDGNIRVRDMGDRCADREFNKVTEALEYCDKMEGYRVQE